MPLRKDLSKPLRVYTWKLDPSALSTVYPDNASSLVFFSGAGARSDTFFSLSLLVLAFFVKRDRICFWPGLSQSNVGTYLALANLNLGLEISNSYELCVPHISFMLYTGTMAMCIVPG